MKINRKTHLLIGLQDNLFIVLMLAVIALLAYLSTEFKAEFDWTAGARNTLSEASQKLLKTLPGPVKVTAFARENKELRDQISELIARYQRYKDNITLAFVNPDTQPQRVRELSITTDGELLVEYDGRSEKVQNRSEDGVSNVLQQLARKGERKILYVEGHGERSLLGQADQDLGQFGGELARKGIKLAPYNLAKNPEPPRDISVLIIAGPTTAYLPGEADLITKYLEAGGNLLWLLEPNDLKGLQSVANYLGVEALPGTVVDAATQLLNIRDPKFALVPEYPPHPVTRNLRSLTVFPIAAALKAKSGTPFQATAVLNTLDRAWNETGPIEGQIQPDPAQGEQQGALTLGYAFTRSLPDDVTAQADEKVPEKTREQRVMVIGNGNFLANNYLGNGDNLQLGFNLIQWLDHDDHLLDIPIKLAPDQKLELSETTLSLLSTTLLIFLPLVLFGAGARVWWVRRRA